MATAPPKQRIGSYPVEFVGAWYGARPVTRRDNSVATTRTGIPLVSVRLVSTGSERADAFSVTMQETSVPKELADGAQVRIPGSVSVTKDGDRVYVNAWGFSVELVGLPAELAEVPTQGSFDGPTRRLRELAEVNTNGIAS